MRPDQSPLDRYASVNPAPAPAPKWGLPQPVAVVAMAGGGAAQFGLAALLAPATPTPTPNPSGVAGCHRWKYALHWDRPSRLATLKNALGKWVTIRKAYAAPGGGTQNDWPDPILHSVDWTGAPNAGAWDYTSPPAVAATTAAYDHDCDNFIKGGPACKAPNPPGDPDGEHPGIYYTIGPADAHSEIVDWSWTLNYGYAKAPGLDIIYGLDPGPPLLAYDMTAELVTGNSIPDITGTPLAFPSTWTTRCAPLPCSGVGITNPTSPGVGGVGQATWQTLLPSDVVGNTADKVNWGLMTFGDVSADPIQANWCGDPLNYHELVPIVSNDSGDVSAIEDYLRLKYYSSLPHPGLFAAGGTPTKHAIEKAGTSIATSWSADPKKRCARPWGVILCTDGLSNTCNTGATTRDEVWAAPQNVPCANDVTGIDFPNYPPGAAEAVYNAILTDGGGAAIIKPRTYAIGIAPEVGRCELNRIAYRGRTDAGAPRKDAGFLLYDPAEVPAPPKGDFDLPHINPPGDESGGGAAPSPNRFRFDQTPPKTTDYAFFALDTKSIVKAFNEIVASTAAGDYSTSAPVSGAAIAAGAIVLLPSTEYPSWWGHLRALDTTKVPASAGYIKWDAANVLLNPDGVNSPWQPTPATRAIYTWDTSGNLVPVDAAHLSGAAGVAALSGVPGQFSNAAGCDPNVPSLDPSNLNCGNRIIDFIRGNDGTGVKRNWLLGPAINSTPAVVGAPYVYKQAGNVVPHATFETDYKKRRPLAWVGSDDGFVHAFDFDDGTEIIALLPPNLLANQVSLYYNFLYGDQTDTGQQIELNQHIWGVANSFRFADVYFPAGFPTGWLGGYKTVGFVTEGPAGSLVAAVDVTHPFPGRPAVGLTPLVDPDTNYDFLKPVEILWTKDESNYSGLHGSWSVPAVAADVFATSRMFFGAGINPASLYSLQADATLFIVDPIHGTLNKANTIAAIASPPPSPLVGQQTFADSVFFQTKVGGYLPDNVANLNVQADLDGRAWFTYGNFAGGTATSKIGIDLNYAAVKTVSGSQTPIPQPMYYSPAVTGQGTTGCQFYALASGSLYETSPAVSGWNVNRSGPPPAGSGFPPALPSFTPYLYVGVNPYPITDPHFAQTPLGKFVAADPKPMDTYILKQLVGGDVPEALDLPPGDPALGSHTKLGIHTQVTSSPIMIVDNTGKGEQQALFLLYDPDNGCFGISYVAILTFKVPANCGTFDKNKFTQIQVYGAGPGAASGFTLTADKLFASKSGVGRGQSAGLQEVNVPVNTLSGSPSFLPIWWRDVK